MNHGSLFSGIGGFDLAAHWMGWTNLFHCEMNPFCRTVLKHYWPSATSYENIKTFDARIHRGTVHIISGGFPCQPFSQAGQRQGTQDDRYLWPEMLRIIREVCPRWVVAENVFGLTNWNRGMVFDQIYTDLESAGYQVQSFVLPAAAVGANHIRKRIWFVAHADGFGPRGRRYEPLKETHQENTNIPGRLFQPEIWTQGTNESPVCSRHDGFSFGLDSKTFPRWRSESLKAFGNAIVPQVAYQIFRTIQTFETIQEQL
ncbi:MAG: DNA (cytosine-5-)-methyltransferase [Filimonas sp.]|nr:DNA (cytosine-5-)-methyltransferase [Filimonas sp.]